MIYTHGKNLLTRDELNKIPVTPRGHRSQVWEGINHGVLADTIVKQIQELGLAVASEAWYCGEGLHELYGCVDIAGSDVSLDIGQEATLSLGVRHSNAGRYAVQFAVGARVSVCSNGLFAGDFVLRRRHTKGIQLEDMISEGIKRYLSEAESLESFVHSMQAVEIDDRDAAYVILKSSTPEVKAMKATQVMPVWETWQTPKHEEFEPRNVWSLYNSFTEVAKEWTPQNQLWTLSHLRPFVESEFGLLASAN